MKSKRLSSIFLCFLLVFTLVVAAGCENNTETEDNKKTPDVADKDTKTGVETQSSKVKKIQQRALMAPKTEKFLKT